MKSERRFYVYLHINPKTGRVFYVGKGTGRRANQLSNRNELHTAIQNWLAKEGLAVEIRIIATNLTNDEAKDMERQQIAFWRADGCDLTNKSSGGEGTEGWVPHQEWRDGKSELMRNFVFTDEIRKKIGDSKRGIPRTPEERAAISAGRKGIRTGAPTEAHRQKLSEALTGYIHTDATRANMGAGQRGRIHTPEHIAKRVSKITGQKRTLKTRAKMSEAAAHRRTAIRCIDDGRIFESAKDASAFYGIQRSALCMVCKGRAKSAGGKRFEYYKEALEESETHGQ